MSPPSLQTYADAITKKVSALPNCFGHIDGTVRPICRAQENEKSYTKDTKNSAVKTPTVALRCGMIANMYEPVGSENFRSV